MSEPKAILVIGAGDATGGAIARRFAREGYIACVTRRNVEKLEPLLAQIRADGGMSLHPDPPTGGILFHDKNNRDLERLMQDSVENAAFYRMNVDLLRTRFEMLKVAVTQRP